MNLSTFSLVSLLLLFVSHALPLRAFADAEASARPFLTAPRTELPPEIDGVLADGCWQRAARASNFFVMDARRLAKRQTIAYLCWDTQNIYVAFECEQPEDEPLSQNVKERDSNRLWLDDSVEFFVNAQDEAPPIHHVIVNAAGAVYDESVSGEPTSWDAEIEVGVTTAAKNWIVELSLPLKDLQPELKEGSTWRVNFNRHATEPRELSSWSPVSDGFFNSGQFGSVRFVANAAGVGMQDIGDSLGDLGPGGASLRLHLANPNVSPLTARILATTESPAGAWKSPSPVEVVLERQSAQVVAAPYAVVGRGDATIRILVTDEDQAIFDSGVLPLKDRFLRPRIREVIRRSQQHIAIIDGLQSSLTEVVTLRAELVTSLNTAYRLTKSVDLPREPTAAFWLEVDRKLRVAEDVLHDGEVTLSVLSGYTQEELRGTGMVRQYVLFTKPPFETAAPNAMPEKDEIRRTVAMFATPGEIEAATFLIRSKTALENVTVKATDFIGHAGKIPAAAIDIHILRHWWQAGRTPVKDEQLVLVPELLLKDDRVILKGALPDNPPRNDPVTDVPAGGTKQFWVTVSVPPRASAGAYLSTLSVSAPGQPSTSLTMQLRVLPFVLPVAPQYLGVEYRNRLEEGQGLSSVPQGRYQAEMQNIRDHGFQAVTVFDTGDKRNRALAFIQKSGMRGPVAVVDGFQQTAEVSSVLDEQRRWKYPPVSFYLPELVETKTEIETARKKLLVIRAGGGTTMVVTTPEGAEELRGVLDTPVYSVTNPDFGDCVRDRILGKAAPLSTTECYTWEAMQEDPSINRLFCGFYLWKSRMRGILPKTYQSVIAGEDPFNDGAGSTLRQRMMTYPSKQGVIDTIQWEAAREGIDDLRYLTFLEQLITGVRNVRRPGLPEAIANAEKSLARVRSVIQSDYRISLKSLRPRDYQKLRWDVAEAGLKILDAMGK